MLVAVSGGADSIALLLALCSLRREFGFEVAAAHLHHRLRGQAADGDLAFVAALCLRLRVPLVSARWNARARMKRRGLSGHAGLRVLRREFLIAAARRLGAATLATAHTADDQLETVLMRLARGAGLQGLAGMRARRGAWIKPLLECTRREIENDLRARGQIWREDLSNSDPHYFRARIRHDVIPALLGPGGDLPRDAVARERLARRVAAATLELGEAAAWVNARARRVFAGVEAAERGGSGVSLDALALTSPAIRRAALRQAWRRAAPGAPGLMQRQLAALIVLIENRKPGASALLPAQRVALVREGRLVIERLANGEKNRIAATHREPDPRAPARGGKLTPRVRAAALRHGAPSGGVR